MTHSPTPWKRITGDIVDNNYNLICDFVPDVDNANFICKCVNNHDALIQSLTRIVDALDPGQYPIKVTTDGNVMIDMPEYLKQAVELLKQMDGE